MFGSESSKAELRFVTVAAAAAAITAVVGFVLPFLLLLLLFKVAMVKNML